MQGVGIRYQYIDTSGKIIASFNNDFPADLAPGDSDAYTYKILGAVPEAAKQMRCIVVGGTFAGKSWKRGQPWSEPLRPLTASSALPSATANP